MISIKSYAKINIALNVEGKCADGYHLLDSVALPLELHDTILLSTLKNARDTYVTIDDFSQGIIDYNIATLAIEKFHLKYGLDNKYRVYIHKVIPMQAGLGGGSSNAAFILKAINKLSKVNAGNEELKEIGKTIGADVPFFIDAVPARMQGIGEVLTPIEIKNNYYVLLVKPHDGLSTKEVFAKSDELKLETGNIDKVIEALRSGDDDLLADSIVNSLEKPAIELLPEIDKIKGLLRGYGVKIVGMTGSGSAVFALSQNKKLLKQIEKELEDKYVTVLTKILK